MFVGPGAPDDDWRPQAFSDAYTPGVDWWVPAWVVAATTEVPSFEAMGYIERLARARAIPRRILTAWRMLYAPECMLGTGEADSPIAAQHVDDAFAQLDQHRVAPPELPENWPTRDEHPRQQLYAIAKGDDTFFPPSAKVARTAYHVRVRDVIHALIDTRRDYLDAIVRTLEARIGQPNAFVAAYLLWRFAVPGVYECTEPFGVDDIPYEAWPAAWKPVSVAVKKYGAPPGVNIHVSALAEAETLVGYGFGDVDWEEERRRRVTPSLATTFRTGEIRNAIARLYFEALHDAKGGSFDLKDFWRRRWFWLAAGSEAGATDKFTPECFRDSFRTLAGRIVRHTHRSAAESRGAEYLLQLLDSLPSITATASAKVNERGKVRALYAGDPRSYYITAAALDPAEADWTHPEAILQPGAPDELHAVADRRTALEAGVGMMYDFDDFNIMHQHEHLAVVFEELARAPPGRGPAHRMCCAWVATAARLQKVVWPDGRLTRVTNGLFSGWRATTWANTILNWAYFTCAVARVRKIMEVNLLARRHVGDDVFSVVDSWLGAVTLSDALQEANARGQPNKIMFSERVAEFLRVRYDETGVHGYVARALCGLIGGDPTAAAVAAPLERISAIADTTARCVARGLDSKVGEALMLRLSRYWGAARPTDAPVIPPPDAVIYCRRDANGAGVFWDGRNSAKYAHCVLPRPPGGPGAVVDTRRIPTMATDDAVAIVRASMPSAWHDELSRVRQTFADASYARPLGAGIAEASATRHHEELARWYELCQNSATVLPPIRLHEDTLSKDADDLEAEINRALEHEPPKRSRLTGAVSRIPGVAVALSARVWHTPAGVKAILQAMRPALVAEFGKQAALIGPELAARLAWGELGTPYCGHAGVSPMLRDYAALVRNTIRARHGCGPRYGWAGCSAEAEYRYAAALHSCRNRIFARVGVVHA
nr:MAG: RNA-dependent RNA polymerase [Totiviridae sp.]